MNEIEIVVDKEIERKKIEDKIREEKKLEGKLKTKAIEIETLTFFDGVILVREILHRIIDEFFDEEDKDRYGFEYAPSLWDKIEDILENNVLYHICDQRAKYLHNLFDIKNC